MDGFYIYSMKFAKIRQLSFLFHFYSLDFIFRKTIVCPRIDVLSWNTFAFEQGRTNIIGTFSWKMLFRWSKFDEKLITNHALPIR